MIIYDCISNKSRQFSYQKLSFKMLTIAFFEIWYPIKRERPNFVDICNVPVVKQKINISISTKILKWMEKKSRHCCQISVATVYFMLRRNRQDWTFHPSLKDTVVGSGLISVSWILSFIYALLQIFHLINTPYLSWFCTFLDRKCVKIVQIFWLFSYFLLFWT